MFFNYTAVDKNGRIVKDSIEANDRVSAHEIIEKKGLYIIDIKEINKQKRSLNFNINISFGSKVKPQELIIFTEQFSTLIGSGLSIVDTLKGLAVQTQNKTLQNAILDIEKDIENGSSISTAFSKHKNIFPDLYINLLAVGEATGNLDKILHNIAHYIERDLSVKRKISSAFAYPRFVIIVVLSVVIFLVSYILPKFVSIYTQAGEQLPTPTLILLSLSNFLRRNYILIIAVVVLLYVAYRLFYNTKSGRLLIDKLKLQIPIFGNISKTGLLSRFSHSFSLVLSSGIDIVSALDIASKVTGNAYMIEQLMKVKEAIIAGESISEAMANKSIFPPIMSQSVSVGEKSGSLDTIIEKVASLWDEDLDYEISTISARIEPTMIVILAFIVGFVALAMYLPMFSLPSTYQKTL